MLMLGVLFVALGFSANVQAANYYVTPSGGEQTPQNGSDWGHALADFSSIPWGSGTGQVGAGDTLYVGSGTYAQAFSPGVSGASGNPITIRAAQDTYTGVVNFAAINMNSRSYIHMDGGYNGAMNFNFTQGFSAQASSHNKWLYFTKMGENSIEMLDANYNELGYFQMGLPAGSMQDRVLFGGQRNQVSAYDQTLIHDGSVTIPGAINNGYGADGIQTGVGYTLANIKFQSVVGYVPSEHCEDAVPYGQCQHQDLIQGAPYLKILNCEFIDTGNSQVDFAWGAHNLMIYNSVFRSTKADMGVITIRIYPNSGTITSASQIQIDNNTFIDSANRFSYGAAIQLQDWTTNTCSNCSIQNNIFFNTGKAWDVIFLQRAPAQTGWTFRNNLVNAGSVGNTKLSGWTQTSGAQTGAPVFVNYAPYNNNSDLHLAATDTAARDKGVDLSASFTTDKEGNSRTGLWDIGAYEFGSGSSSFVYHPADTNTDYLISLNEATTFGACWKTNCNANATLDNVSRAGYLWKGSATGAYQYNSANTCPICWGVNP